MDITDINNSLTETVRMLQQGSDQLQALHAKAKEIHNSEENRYNFEYAINRLERAKEQMREAIQALPENFNG